MCIRDRRNSILKHQSQMESAPFLGNDERLFWQRSEDRNRGTAALYDSLGLALSLIHILSGDTAQEAYRNKYGTEHQ